MISFDFPVGFQTFHENNLLNFQMNRWYSTGCLDYDELREAAADIKDFEGWKEAFKKLAEQMKERGKWLGCATCLRAADFFALGNDPEKDKLYEACMEAYQKAYQGEPVIYEQVPYQSGWLPVMRIMCDNPAKGWILLHGGYDSYIQEFYPFCTVFVKAGYNVILFEGPGQGGALNNYDLKLTHEWEKPVSVILDHYKLEDVTLIGVSLGGYLAARAAAFEKRIKRVVLYDIIYDLFNSFLSKNSPVERGIIKLLLHFEHFPLWKGLESKSNQNLFARWLVLQGYQVYGAKTLPQYLKCLRFYNTIKISRYITQDVLMLAGEEDIYTKYFKAQKRKLINAASVTGRIFSKEENASHHCQVGNIGLALRYILEWLEEKRR